MVSSRKTRERVLESVFGDRSLAPLSTASNIITPASYDSSDSQSFSSTQTITTSNYPLPSQERSRALRHRDPVKLGQNALAPDFVPSQIPTDEGHELKQREWNESWAIATESLELPSIPRGSGNILQLLGAASRPHVPNLEAALERVLFPEKHFPHTVQTRSLTEWYTKEARRHFITQMELTITHLYGQVQELEPEGFVSEMLKTLHSAYQLYSQNLSSVCKVLEVHSPGSSGVILDRFQAEMYSTVNNSIPASFMEAIRIVFERLVAVILDPISSQFDDVSVSPSADAPKVLEARSQLLRLVKTLSQVGLAGRRFQIIFAEIMDEAMKRYITQRFRGRWVGEENDPSMNSDRKTRLSNSSDIVTRSSRQAAQSQNIMRLCDWIENKYSRLCVEVFNQAGEVDIAWTDVEKWKEAGISNLTALRINESFDIVNRWPDCHGAIDDLRTAVTTPMRRLLLTDSFIAILKQRLLHPGTSTLHILQVYISMIWSFHALDNSKVLLDRVAYPLQEYLCGRDDTVRLIITGLLADTVDSDGNEVVPGGDKLVELALLLQKGADSGKETPNDDELDWHDMEWQPDPVDAGPGYKRTKHADVIGTMIRELGTQEIFIKEFQTIIGENLLKQEDNFDKEVRIGCSSMIRNSNLPQIKVLELLKSRFGEGQLQSCEVMIKDIQDSERLNSAIIKLQRIAHKRQHVNGTATDAEDPDDPLKPSLNPKVLSRLFWPQLNDEEYKIPTEVASIQANYEKGFQMLKSARKLTWLHALGQATVELELSDRTVVEEVHTWQATVIWAFGSDESGSGSTRRSVQELVDGLEMDEALVRSALHFWVGKLVLEEIDQDTFAVMETLTQEDLARSNAQGGDNAAALDEGDADAAMIGTGSGAQDGKMQIYWQFIQGMLTNSSPQMPLQQIAMMLKMLIADGFPYSNEELQEFLGTKVEAGELEFVAGKYKLKK